MGLCDSIFENMTHADVHVTLRPKVQAWNLHTQLPTDLNFLILLSSLSGVLGSSGESNYAVGNPYQDALAPHRHARSLTAASVDVGMMLQVGFIAETAKVAESLVVEATWPAMYEAELLAILDYLCDPDQPRRRDSPLRSQVLTGVMAQGMH